MMMNPTNCVHTNLGIVSNLQHPFIHFHACGSGVARGAGDQRTRPPSPKKKSPAKKILFWSQNLKL